MQLFELTHGQRRRGGGEAGEGGSEVQTKHTKTARSKRGGEMEGWGTTISLALVQTKVQILNVQSDESAVLTARGGGGSWRSGADLLALHPRRESVRRKCRNTETRKTINHRATRSDASSGEKYF